MKSAAYLSPFRLEIRDLPTAGAEATAPWFGLDFAQTADQAADKIKRHKIAADCETRVVPNEAINAAAPTIEKDTPATRLLVEQLQTDLIVQRRELAERDTEIAKLKGEKAPRVKALADSDTLPEFKFGPGEYLQDEHSENVVRVLEINPLDAKTGKRRPGFSWEMPGKQPGEQDATGFCPAESSVHFRHVIDKKHRDKTIHAIETGTEKAAHHAAHAPRKLVTATRVNRTPAKPHKPAAHKPHAS